ncbi:MAG TPA: BON domain-containing protein [Burkholderiaceae bacterium]|jgi:osmotically-inducible protein OsmY|nr:BON domain-containing protein [Burkholderiaceae bacterium]
MRLRATALMAALVSIAAGVAACAPLAVTGIVAGAAVVADRRPAAAIVDDQALQVRATQRVKEVLPGTDLAYAYVTVFNGRMLLTGLAPDERSREQAARVAAGIDKVRAVHNEIQVLQGTSLPSGLHDTTVTARVRASMLQQKTLDIAAIRVTTQDRTVYLMGLVTEQEAALAADAASRTGGVGRVVTLFDYISEQELAALRGRPGSEPDGSASSMR